MVDINREQLVILMDKSLFFMGFKDIEKTVMNGGQLAAFILGACFIDALAGFYAGVTQQESERGGSGKRFSDFVEQYMTKYDKNELWKDLRCGLVHSYASGPSYVYTNGNQAGFHFNLTPANRKILNLEDFLSDIREAYRIFRNDIMTKDDIFGKAKRRYLSMGLMGEVQIDKV